MISSEKPNIESDTALEVGIDTPPASGDSSGHITKIDHDNDPATPPISLVPGLDTAFETPDANGVFASTKFLPEGIYPSDITRTETAQLNPCALATCTADETAAGKDNLEDLIVLTKAGKPSYTLLRDPASPTSLVFQTPSHVADLQTDHRDVVIGYFNDDDVLDMALAVYDSDDIFIYGDQTRPGKFDELQYLPISGSGTKQSIEIEVADLDNDPSTPDDVLIAPENADAFIVHRGNVLLSTVIEYSSFAAPIKGMKLVKGVGYDTDSHFGVFLRDNVEDFTFTWTVADELHHLDKTIANSHNPGSLYVRYLEQNVLSDARDIKSADLNGDGVPDFVVLYYSSPNNIAANIYFGKTDAAGEGNDFLGTPTPVGNAAVKGVSVEVIDTNNDGTADAIQVLDENGGVHHYTSADWSAGAVYASVDSPIGSTTPATEAYDYQDSTGAVTHADFDADGFEDILDGNLLYLSTLTPTKGDFSTTAPIAIEHGPAPLAVVGFDADGDSDVDVFVVPGQDGQTTKPPYILFNRGDGRLDEPDARVELTNIPTPAGGWKSNQKLIASGKIAGFGAESIVYVNDDATGQLMIIQPTGATSTTTAATPAQWQATPGSTLAVTGVEHVIIADHISNDGNKEILVAAGTAVHQIHGDPFTVDSLTGLSANAALTIASGQIDSDKGDFKDLVYCGATTSCTVLYGSDAATEAAVTVLANRATSTHTSAFSGTTVDASTLKVIVEDFDDNGYGDILVSSHSNPSTIYREIVYMTDTIATSVNRDINALTKHDITIAGETGEIQAIYAVDLTNSGSNDLIYSIPGGRVKTVLDSPVTRDDLNAIANNLIEHLALELNPSTLQVEGGTPSTDGAWFDNAQNPLSAAEANQDITQWGLGQVQPDSTAYPRTATVGAPVDPSTLTEHNECTLLASTVVPVTVELYIEFPIVPCLEPGAHALERQPRNTHRRRPRRRSP